MYVDPVNLIRNIITLATPETVPWKVERRYEINAFNKWRRCGGNEKIAISVNVILQENIEWQLTSTEPPNDRVKE